MAELSLSGVDMAEPPIDTQHTTLSIPQNDHSDGLQPTGHTVPAVADGSRNPGTAAIMAELSLFRREVRGEIANLQANLQGFREEFQQFVHMVIQNLTHPPEKGDTGVVLPTTTSAGHETASLAPQLEERDIEDLQYVVHLPLHEKSMEEASVESHSSCQWEKEDEGDALQLLVDEHVVSESVKHADQLASIMDDDDVGPQSIFVVVSHDGKRNALSGHTEKPPYFSSILQLKTPQINDQLENAAAANLVPEQIKKIQVNEKEFVARFSQPQVVGRLPNLTSSSPISWLFSPPTSSTEDLYIVPDCSLDSYYIHVGAPLHGFKVNFSNGEMCRPIIPPAAPKFNGRVVNRGGHIYFMASPYSYYETPDPVFECYDPVENKWKALEPFPDRAVHLHRGFIVATAVWDDTILYNMDGCKIWAYNVDKDKWYIVNVEDDRCYSIVREAIVVENTIYAFKRTDSYNSYKKSLDLLMALSIEREEINGDDVYKCSLLAEISVPGMDEIKYDDAEAYREASHLVHLGKDNFCLVQSCRLKGFNRSKPIKLTGIKLTRERSMIVTGVCVYEVELMSDEQFHSHIQRAEQPQEHNGRTGVYKETTELLQKDCGVEIQQFEVTLCFSLPDSKTAALKQGESFLFNLDPFPGDYASENIDKTEGNCICVRNLPPDVTCRQLEHDLECNFKDIQRAGIRVVINNTGNPFAIVEFESATSKQRAIEVSSIVIGNGLSLVDCHRASGSSSSGMNKLKNHGAEVSPSKTICGGHNVQGGDAGYQLRSCSNSSIMVDDAGPQSLFVVVSWGCKAPCSISILQLDTQKNSHESAAVSITKQGFRVSPPSLFSSLETQLNQKEYVAHLSRPQGFTEVQWVLTSSTSSEELYMFPYLADSEYHFPLHSCIFNLRTKTTRQSKTPLAAKKFGGRVVNLGGRVVNLSGCSYFMAKSSDDYFGTNSSFGCYDPVSDSWRTLEPFPLDSCSDIQATAVWKDTILFLIGGMAIWAYDGDKWYHVIVEDTRCYRIEGEAVVLENTIYALTTMSFGLVLALSIERNEIGGDLVFKCSLRSKIPVPKMKRFAFKDLRPSVHRHLVLLDKDNFCLVQTCNRDDHSVGYYDYQPIHLTNIKLNKEENTMTVTGECVHMLRILEDEQFEVLHCFSLPKCKTTARKEGERFLFDLNPYPAGLEKAHLSYRGSIPSHVYAMPSFAPKASTLGEGAAAERSNSNGEGHSICLRSVPSDATFRQLNNELKKFGPVKDEGIQFMKDNTGSWFAIVEFENATSKQLAIKASAIVIKGCRIKIDDFIQDKFLSCVNTDT